MSTNVSYNILNFNQVIDAAKSLGYKYFSDERSMVRPIENFIIIFYSKYSDVNHDFDFYITNYSIIAKNISGFEYRFPLSK